MRGIEYLDLTSPEFRENPCASRASAGSEADILPVRVEQVDVAGWDEFAVTFADVRQEQISCFNLAKWGAERLEWVIVKKGDDILGAAVVIVVNVPFLHHGLALVKWGPLWRPLGQRAEPKRLRTILAALQREYAQQRGYLFSVLPPADPDFTDTITSTLEDLGFAPGWSFSHPARYLVNVDIAPEALRQSLGQKWRYNLKKSAGSALRIEVDDTNDALERFMSLYNQMLTRKGFQDMSAISTLPVLMGSEVGAIQPQDRSGLSRGPADGGRRD